MNQLKLLKLLFLILGGFIVAILGIGTAYPRIYSPLQNYGKFQKIDQDRWIQEGAEIDFDNLATRGNKLSFYFDSWYPENLAFPQVQVFVCDQLVSQFTAKPSSNHDIYLKGECQPRKVQIKSLSPFITSAEDSRRLIIKLDHLELSGKYGFVLTTFQPVLVVVGAFFISLFLLTIIFPGLGGVLISCGGLVGGYFLIASFYQVSPNVLLNFYYFFTLFILGLVVAKFNNQKVELSFKLISPSKLTSLAIAVAFLAGAFLRFYDIDFGLPANYHPDEVPKYNAVERMRFYGDLNPRYFLHPTLLLYSAYFFNWILRIATSSDLPWMETLILSGRMMSATAGCFSIILTALIAKRLFNNYASGISAFLIAVFPLHVTCSRYLKEDSLLVFFILLAVYLVVRSVQEDRPWGLLLAGFIAGCSASVKYTGLVSVMILVAAPFLKSEKLIPDRNYLKWTIRAIFILPLAFIFASPYTLLDLGKFLQDFNYERSHMATGHDGLITAGSQLWTYHLSRSLWHGVEPLALSLGVISLGYLLYKNKIKYWYILALFLLYYIPAEYVKAKPAPQPERYVVPCLPFLAIAIGVMLSELGVSSKKFFGRALIGILVILAFSYPAIRSLDLAQDLRPDTRDLMGSWISTHLPSGSKILIDLPAYQAPISSQQFNIIPLTRDKILEELDPKFLEKTGAEYLLMSSLFYDRYYSQPGIPPHLRQIINQVFKSFPIVQEFEASSGTYGFNNPKITLFKISKS